MCDCYEHKCSNPDCDQLMPVHIGDFCTPRENLEVYCSRHLPKTLAEFDGAVWKWFKVDTSHPDDIPKGLKVGIRILDKSKVYAWEQGWNRYKDFIHPNSTCCEKIKDW